MLVTLHPILGTWKTTKDIDFSLKQRSFFSGEISTNKLGNFYFSSVILTKFANLFFHVAKNIISTKKEKKNPLI